MIYTFLNWLDSIQPQIEIFGNITLLVGIFAIAIWWYVVNRETYTHGWSLASKSTFGMEVRKNG